MNLPKRLSGRRNRPEVPDAAHEEAGGSGAGQLAYMNWVADTVGEYGWAVSGLHGAGQAPPWVYSTGMWLTCQSPELVICGAPVRNAASIINVIGTRIADGAEFTPEDELDDVCPARLTFRPVDLSWRMTRMFAISDAFYGMVRPPYLQVVWADKYGRFPWDAGFHRGYTDMQPLLWLPRDDNPPSAWTRLHQAA